MAAAHSSDPVAIEEVQALARQGHPDAIATLIQRTLPSPHIQVKVAWKDHCLGILLESDPLPSQAILAPLVRFGIEKVQVSGFQTLRIYGRLTGQSSPAWCEVIEPTSHAAPPTIRHNLYDAFILEAQEVLTELEQDLLSLREDSSPRKIYNLLRLAHTIKGGAASVGLIPIAKVAHILEDVFAALRHPNIHIDAEIEALLFQGYECLWLPLMAEFSREPIDEADLLNRATAVMDRLQVRLKEGFDQETALPSSTDLGFDLVQNMFQVGIAQRLADLERALLYADPQAIATTLREKAEVFLGLAESVNLPGFGAIAQTTLQALDAHPDQVLRIAQLAFDDFSEGQRQVLEMGDRTQGGYPSAELQQMAHGSATSVLPARSADLGDRVGMESAIDLFPLSMASLESAVDSILGAAIAPEMPLALSPLANTPYEAPLTDLPLENLPLDETELSLDAVFGHYSGLDLLPVPSTESFLENDLENGLNNALEKSLDNSLENALAQSTESFLENDLENGLDNALEKGLDNSFEDALESFSEDVLKNTLENALDSSSEDVLENTFENALYSSSENFLENTSDHILDSSPENFLENALANPLANPLDNALADAFENVLDTSLDDTLEAQWDASSALPLEMALDSSKPISSEVPVDLKLLDLFQHLADDLLSSQEHLSHQTLQQQTHLQSLVQQLQQFQQSLRQSRSEMSLSNLSSDLPSTLTAVQAQAQQIEGMMVAIAQSLQTSQRDLNHQTQQFTQLQADWGTLRANL